MLFRSACRMQTAVRLRQQTLDVAAVLRTRGHADTEAEQWFAADRGARIPCHLLQNAHLGVKELQTQAGQTVQELK